MQFDIPTRSGEALSVNLKAGEVTFIVGANGTGKSSLLHHVVATLPKSKFLPANRETVLDSAAISISANDAKTHAEHEAMYARTTTSRHRKTSFNDTSRIRKLLFLLKAREEYQRSLYVDADLAGNDAQKTKALAEMPLRLLNSALTACSLDIQLSWDKESSLMAKRTRYAAEYGADSLSEGERAALVLAGEVILAERDGIIILDEPERHLHRSISSALLSFLVSTRSDLAWIVATHDIDSLQAFRQSKIVILDDFDGSRWSVRQADAPEALPETLREALIGARRRVIFVEGIASSLDRPLYSAVYPAHSIIAVGSRADVISAVTEAEKTKSLHHFKSYGIVDLDNKDDKEPLAKNDVYVLSFYSIESIYYHPDVVKKMIESAPSDCCFVELSSEVVSLIGDGEIDRFAKDAAYKRFDREYALAKPDYEQFSSIDEATRELPDGPRILSEVRLELEAAVRSGSWIDIIKAMKIKSTRVPKHVARKLGYLNASAYEMAVRKRLAIDSDFKELVSSLTPALPD